MERLQYTTAHHHFSTTGITEVSRKRGPDIYQVIYPEDLIKYHHNMDGVDWGDQLREHGDGFSTKHTFKSVTNVFT